MQVILREDVSNLGRIGDVVVVKNGYARNYLIPRELAVPADPKSVKRLEHEKRVIAQRERTLMRKADAIKQKIEGLALNISKQTGEESKLFGSVTTREIADALAAQGVEIDRKAIQLAEPIRTVGVHEVRIRLARDVEAALKVWVVAAD